LAAGNDEAAGKAFAASYINKPMWEEPLRMVAEEISVATEDASTRATALNEGIRLIKLALPVDPILAADLARLAGPMIWTAMRNQIGAMLRDWFSIDDPHHRQLALAAMLATGSDDFADILVPLLTAEDRQVRIRTYQAGEAFYPASLGANWRSVVAGWHEDARADFVFEVTHRALMADVAQDFALNDPSIKVREQAIQELSWIWATDALERIANNLDDAALDTLLPAFFPEVLPETLRPRFIAANRRLVAREATPLGRIQRLLRGVEFGDTVAMDLITELTALSSPVDQQAQYAIGEALKIVKPHTAAWVSDWLTAKLLDGTLWVEYLEPFLLPVSKKKATDLIHKLATRELEYREASATRMILSAGATPELATQVFDKWCHLQHAVSAGDTPRLMWKCIDQLRGILRSISDVAVAGIMPSLQGDFDSDKFRVVTDIFGSVNADAEELRSEMSETLRQSLRHYLKEGIAKLLGEDLFDDSNRSEAAISLGRIGDAEDLADLQRMIDADIKPPRGSGSITYSNWYVRAVLWLDAPDTDATLIALLRQEKYQSDAARGLLQLAVPPNPEKPLAGNTTNFEAIWTARAGVQPPGFDPTRAKRYAEAIKQRIAELKKENEANPQAFTGRIKDLAVLVAVLDGRDSADFVINTLALPGQWDAYARMRGIRALLMSGATLTLDCMLSVLDPAIEHMLSQGLYEDRNLWLLVDCLELLPFSDDPARAIARIEEVMTKYTYWPYQFRDLVTAMGHTRSDAAVPFLIRLARGEGGVQNMDGDWVEALGRLNTVASRQALLSFVDPEIPWVGVNINFDYHNTEIFAAFVAGWAGQDPALKQRLLALSQGNLTSTQRQLLLAIYREMGSGDTLVAGVNLLRGTMSPFGRDRGFDAQFLEQQPHGGSGTFVLVPRNAEKARAELFHAVLNDPGRRASAF
jgi:hypothetical protein